MNVASKPAARPKQLDPAASKLPRILFSPPAVGLHSATVDLRSRIGMLPGLPADILALEAESRVTTPNTGNMIHVESPARLFSVDRPRSAMGAPERAPKPEGGGAAEIIISNRFDAVILAFANIVRDYGHVDEVRRQELANGLALSADLVRHAKVPVYAFGVGIQDAALTRAEMLPELLDLLSALDSHAALFGVRGEATARYLHALGFSRALAIGCPSAFVFPRNVLAAARPAGADGRVLAAGHMQYVQRGGPRAAFLQRVAAECDAHYVFQNDVFVLLRPVKPSPHYNEATGEVDRTAVDTRLKAHGWAGRGYASYRHFRAPGPWRVFAERFDVYFGDRFHGGIAALQAGVPAVFVASDDRVRDLTAFLGLPCVDVEVAATTPVADVFAEALSAPAMAKMRDTYRGRLADFRAHCLRAGLRLESEAEIATLLAAA